MADALILDRALPIASVDRNSTAWLGVLCVIATEASLFAYLLFSYGYCAVQHGKSWLPSAHPSMALSAPGTAILLVSSATVWWAERGVRRGDRRAQISGIACGIALGVVFLLLQSLEWKTKNFSVSSSAYGSFYFTITAFHMLHVVVGLGFLSAVLAWSLGGQFNTRRYTHITISAAYWHFVDAVWLVVFVAFYVSPYLW